MKAFLIKKSGGPRVLDLENIPTPVPGDGEVLVKNEYIGINYAEILSRKGLYGWAPKRPYIPGMESAGVIEQVGPGVDKSKIGTNVVVGAKFGTYSEYISVPENQAIGALEFYSTEENAAFLVNYLTSWVALFRMASIKKGEKVLITAAAGGVGTAAVKLSLKAGCTVYGLAGSSEKVDYLKQLGVTDAGNYVDKNWDREISGVTDGVDVVLELVGGEVNKKCFELLNPFGRMVVAGFASLDLKRWNPYSIYRTYMDIPRFKVGRLAEKSAAVMSTHIGILLDQYPSILSSQIDELISFIKLNDIRPVIDRVFPLENVAEAHEYIESRKSIGKVLLKV